jgi:hypothetical protein
MGTLSIAQIIGCTLTAFGLGYAAGAIQRVLRRAVEVLE